MSTTITSKLKSEGAYILGRVAALGSRPLMLLAANHLVGNELAATIAVVFLVTMLSMAVSAFDSHRNFYQAHFSGTRQALVREKYRAYIASCVLQIAAASIPLTIYLLWKNQDIAFALVVAVFFASERLADESQRFLIFKKARSEWGKRILSKATLQLVGVLVATTVTPSMASTAAVIGLAIGNLVSYGSKLHPRHFPSNLGEVFGAWSHCAKQKAFWMLSAASTVISYMDRIVVMLFQQSDMAIFTLIVSSLSLVQNAVEYFFVSFRRTDMLQAKVTIRDVFFAPRMYAILLCSAAISVGLCLAMIYLYRGQTISEWTLIPIVLFSQIVLALTMVTREIIYWNHDISRLIAIEFTFIAFAAGGVGAMKLLHASYVVVLAYLAVVLVARLLLMAYSTNRHEAVCSAP